jgi:hypothetical protein
VRSRPNFQPVGVLSSRSCRRIAQSPGLSPPDINPGWITRPAELRKAAARLSPGTRFVVGGEVDQAEDAAITAVLKRTGIVAIRGEAGWSRMWSVPRADMRVSGLSGARTLEAPTGRRHIPTMANNRNLQSEWDDSEYFLRGAGIHGLNTCGRVILLIWRSAGVAGSP